jgi:hypothetical protein
VDAGAAVKGGELFVGKTTKPHTCERCLAPIEVATLAVWFKSTKTLAHFSCEIRARRGRK